MFLAGFGSDFGNQNDTNMGLKIDRNFDGSLDRSWKGLGRQGRPAQVWNARGGDHGEG